MGTFEDDFAAFHAEYQKAEARLREIEGQVPHDLKAFIAECQAALDRLPDWAHRGVRQQSRPMRLDASHTMTAARNNSDHIRDLHKRLPACVEAIRAVQSDAATRTNRTQRQKRTTFVEQVNAMRAKSDLPLNDALVAVLKETGVRVKQKNGGFVLRPWSKVQANRHRREKAVETARKRYERGTKKRSDNR